MNNILVVEPKRLVTDKLIEMTNNWESLDATFEHSFQMKLANKYSRIIVDNHSIVDKKEFIEENRASKQIIVIVDYYDKEVTNQYILNNIQIVFRSFGISGLIYKLFGVVERSNRKAEEYKQENRDKKVITVMSPLGGAGKSLLSYSFARLAAKKSKKVLYVDFSTISNVEVMMDKGLGSNDYVDFFSELQSLKVLESIDVHRLMEKSIYSYNEGQLSFDVIFGSSPIKMDAVTEHDVDKFILCVRELDYDVVLIDTSSELSRKNFTLIEASDEVILVSNADVHSGWKMIQYREILDYIQVTQKCSLIINRYNKRYNFSCKELESNLGIKLIGVIPEDRNLTYYSNCGEVTTYLDKSISKIHSGIFNKILPIFDKKEIKQLKVLL